MDKISNSFNEAIALLIATLGEWRSFNYKEAKNNPKLHKDRIVKLIEQVKEEMQDYEDEDASKEQAFISKALNVQLMQN